MLAVLVVAACASSLLAGCNAANILALPVSGSYSHFIVMEPLFKELAARGHQVTVASPYPQKQPLPNYHDIPVDHILEPVGNNLHFDFVNDMGKNPFYNIYRIWSVGLNICESILKSGALGDLYNSTVRYDLVITQLFNYDCLAVFAYKLDAPLVSIVTSSALPWSNGRVGNPDHPAYVLNNFINAHEDMTLCERTLNTLAWLWSSVAIHPLSYSKMNDLVHRYLDSEAPPVQEAIQRTSLVMVNSHFTMLQARPFVPNFIEIGGIHIKDPKPLPSDLQVFLDQATKGAVVFSLGSHIRAGTMENSSLQGLIDAFGSLEQRVVLKFEDPLENVPPNVLVRKWIPQRDILEHRNVRVLMAHGGQSSTIEAVHSGVPLVGMPIFSDQYSNIQSLVLRGAAVLLDLKGLTKERVLEAVNKVIYDPSYKINAQRLSHQFRDRPMSPLQTAVYWTEYVLRHEGAPQLRSRAADTPWHRFLLLDVAALILTLLIAAYYLARFLLKYTVYCLFGVFVGTMKTKYD